MPTPESTTSSPSLNPTTPLPEFELCPKGVTGDGDIFNERNYRHETNQLGSNGTPLRPNRCSKFCKYGDAKIISKFGGDTDQDCKATDQQVGNTADFARGIFDEACGITSAMYQRGCVEGLPSFQPLRFVTLYSCWGWGWVFF